MTTGTTRDRFITLTRRFAAPPAMVFRCWTDPDYLEWFFNPGMPTDVKTTVDLRIGGQWRQHMVVNDETQYMTGGIYREISPGKRLVFEWGAVDGWPDLTAPEGGPVVTIDFLPDGAGCRMDFRCDLPEGISQEEADKWLDMGIDAGWGMTIDRLVAQLGA